MVFHDRHQIQWSFKNCFNHENDGHIWATTQENLTLLRAINEGAD